MISKTKFFTISLFFLFMLLLLGNLISELLTNIAINYSNDKFILPSTIDQLYYILIFSIVVSMVIFYLIFYTKLLTLKEKIIILIVLLLEYFVTVLGFFNYQRLSRNRAYDIFAFTNTIQLIIAGTIGCMISRKYKSEFKKRLLWIILSIGLIYSSFDELFEIHEYIGYNLIYPLFNGTFFYKLILIIVHEPDDFLIFIYFLAVLVVIALFSKVFMEYFKNNEKFIIFFALALLPVSLQILSEKYQLIIIEEVFEIFSSMFFILSFYLLYNSLKNEVNNSVKSSIRAKEK